MTKAEQEKERQEWAARIADYRASGQSVSELCAANGIKPGRLWYRLRRERDQEKANEANKVGPVWLRATVTGPDGLCGSWTAACSGAGRGGVVAGEVLRKELPHSP